MRLLPAEVEKHLQHLEQLGFTGRWIAFERDLWIVLFASLPDTAMEWFRDQADALTDPALRQLHLDCDKAHDLDPHDPFIADLAERIVAQSIQRYGSEVVPVEATGSVPQLLQGSINESSPAWQRLDSLIRRGLAQAGIDVP